MGRRRLHSVLVVGATVTVISRSLVPLLTSVDAPTVVLVKRELGNVDKETAELAVVDGSVVERVSLSVVTGVLGAESYVLYKNVSFEATKISLLWVRHEYNVNFIKQLTFLRLKG